MTEKIIYALGFFDGVHLGHRQLLHACGRLAAQNGALPGTVTFLGHPQTLTQGSAPVLINSIEDRCSLLRRFGAERIVTLAFDGELRQMHWQHFLQLLQAEHGAAGFVCGSDFRFGYRGEGTAAGLQEYCARQGLLCAVVPEQKLEGVRISSTHIRALIEDGQMEQAVRFLGHGHVLTGPVVPGRQLGRTLGVPTANLLLPEGLVKPKFGVYACRTHVDGRAYAAVTNVGTRPTVGGHRITVESWLLEFSGDLYGRELTVEFLAFLRPEEKFPTLQALQEAIQKNAAQTRDFFKNM